MNTKSESSHQRAEAARAHLRVATAADVAAIIALERRVPVAAHWSDQTYRDMFTPKAQARIAKVVENCGAITAFLIARLADQECELENIVVVGSVQRRGTGSKLLRALISEARDRNATRICLEVRDSNIAARALYEKFGFSIIGRRKSYYGSRTNPEDAVLYSLKL